MASLESRQGRSFNPDAPIIHLGGRFITGLVPGLYAGLVMAIVVCILAAAQGVPIFAPFRIVASFGMGSAAIKGGSVATAAGIAIHFVTAGLLGMVFTRIFGTTTMRRLLAFGFFYSMVLWLFVQFVFLPMLNPAVATQLGTVWPFFLGHLAYGLTLASALPTTKDIDIPEQNSVPSGGHRAHL